MKKRMVLKKLRKRSMFGALLSNLLIFSFFLCFTACSTKRNTSATRFFHAMTARFNTLYNGQLSYAEGVEAQEKGHLDDYTHFLPMSISTNKVTASMGKGNYDTAIEKCEKAIKLHSIKKTSEGEQ